MDPITLATAAVAIAAPFLIKSGEKFAENIGEDLWKWIKNRFSKKEEEAICIDQQDGLEERLAKILIEKINSDSNFREQLETVVDKAQNNLQNNSQQNINNHGDIEKQIIIQENKGNITM